jgi:hypothetical protein
MSKIKYLLGLLHMVDVTTTLCKPKILQEQVNSGFIVRCISEFPDMLIVFWDLCRCGFSRVVI